MYTLSADLFTNTRSTGMVIDSFALTLKGETLAFNKVNADRFRLVTDLEFLAIKECYHSASGVVLGSGMSIDTYKGACKATIPWNEPKMGAVLFPEQYPSWEADGESFIEEFKGGYSLTYLGEIAFVGFLAEAKEVLKRAA